MATIVQRGYCQWQAKVRRDHFPTISRTFKTRQEALAWSRAIEGKIDVGSFVDRRETEHVRFVDLIERYLTEVAPRKRSGLLERGKLKSYLGHPLLQRPVASITPRDAAAVRDWRLQQVSPGTVLREFSILRHVLETARREWFLPVENFVSGIRLPAANRPRDRRLRDGEFERLMAVAAAYQSIMVHIIEWQVETGMRREETATLQANDVDMAAGIVHVKRSKNGQPRSIPMSERALAVVKDRDKTGHASVFGIRPGSMSQAFGRVCQRAGIEDLTFHDLRHEATSRFVELGFSMPEVMAITGHKDPKMMLRYYQPDVRKLALRLRAPSA